MPRLHDLWRRVRQTVRTDPPDAVLLARFVRTRDGDAFAELVARHGPLVYSTCRRLLPDPHDVEDAFQATFLVLVKRAGRLAGHDTVGPWLHRVAVWTARSVRRRNARRLDRERVQVTADTPGPSAPVGAQLDLDDALLTLPEKYRAAVVLCHLQGWTRREAAEHLGCPEGTLSAHLSRALDRLRKRLGTDPAVWLAVSATVPAGLANATTYSANQYLSAAAVSPAVAELTRGVLRMFWVKKAVAAGMVLVAAVGLGVGIVGSGGGQRVEAQGRDYPATADEVKRLTKMIEEERAARERLELMMARIVNRLDALPGPQPVTGEATVKQVTFWLTVSRESTFPRHQYLKYTVTERSSSREQYRYAVTDLPSLSRLLSRIAAVVPGEKELRIFFNHDFPNTVIDELRAACKEAGFAKITMGLQTPPTDQPVHSPVRFISPADGVVTAILAGKEEPTDCEAGTPILELSTSPATSPGKMIVRAPVAGRVQAMVVVGERVKSGEVLGVITPKK